MNFSIIKAHLFVTFLLKLMQNVLYMIDSDQRPVSNRRPLLKSGSTYVIFSNHGPILGYSQIGVLSKLSYHDQICHKK
jgi:hypothetical protein